MLISAEDLVDKLLRDLREALSEASVTIEASATDRITIAPSKSSSRNLLEIWARDVADVDVCFHVPDQRGTPFEQVFVGPSNEAGALADEVVDYVRDLVTERKVLAGRLGGARFLPLEHLSQASPRKFRWVRSWRGTHDSKRNAGPGV